MDTDTIDIPLPDNFYLVVAFHEHLECRKCELYRARLGPSRLQRKCRICVINWNEKEMGEEVNK